MPTREKKILELARAYPDDVLAQIDAAYHGDAHRTEEEAIGFYDQAWKLGVPAGKRREFMLGYGSTLKNVGRTGESRSILRQASEEFPEDQALPIFLALTEHAAGQSSQAMARLIELFLDLGDAAPDAKRYERALRFYADELRGEN